MTSGLDVLREVIRAVVALAGLTGATILAAERIFNPDAAIALYGAVLGMYAQAGASAIRNHLNHRNQLPPGE